MGVVFACIPLYFRGVTTTFGLCHTEFIAVKNRSHKILNLLSGSKKIVVLPFSRGELKGILYLTKLAARQPASGLTPDT